MQVGGMIFNATIRSNSYKMFYRFVYILIAINVSVGIFLYLNIQTKCPTPSAVFCEALLQLEQDPLKSTKEHYFLVLVILSSPKIMERRDAIRQTWMKGYRGRTQKVLVQFCIGTEGLSSENMDNLSSEDAKYGDLLFLPHLYDSYNNLTRKILESFVAISTHYTFSYLMKCDDDSFVVLDTILSGLEKRESKESYYWGFFNGRAHVKDKGKWREKKWFLSDRYLPYALGGGYILSQDLVRRIASNSDGLTLYNSEDVSVGVWLSPYDAERRHDVRFNTEFISRGCRNVYLVSHKQSMDEMLSKQKQLEETGRQCLVEYQTRLSYVYNWTAEPSKCCVRVRGVV